MDAQVDIEFKCQTCSHPISLDPAFSNMSEITYAELTLTTNSPLSLDFEGLSLDRTIPSFQDQSMRQTHGFTLVEDTERVSPIQVKSELFNVMSGNSDIDYPICKECTENLLGMLDRGNAKLHKDLSSIKEFLQNKDVQSVKIIEKEQELAKLKEEEKRLLAELEDIQQEQKEADEQLEKYEQEKEKLDKDDNMYWNRFVSYKTQQFSKDMQRKSYKYRLNAASSQLEHLQEKNVFNTCFHIWPSVHFAKINDLRLGTLPASPIDFSEINAAWGQVALLLSSVAKKVDFEFTNYRLVPFGNASYIKVLSDGKELPLHCNQPRFRWAGKFDAAMVAFLECMQELQIFVESIGSKGTDKKVCLPYKVCGHTLKDVNSNQAYSIKKQLNTDEEWTKACKFLLTNLKWLVTWVSSDVFETALKNYRQSQA